MLEPQRIRVVLSFISILHSAEKEAGGREEAGKGKDKPPARNTQQGSRR